MSASAVTSISDLTQSLFHITLFSTNNLHQPWCLFGVHSVPCMDQAFNACTIDARPCNEYLIYDAVLNHEQKDQRLFCSPDYISRNPALKIITIIGFTNLQLTALCGFHLYV